MRLNSPRAGSRGRAIPDRAHVRSVQPAPEFPFVWRWHATPLFQFERFNKRCRLLSNCGTMATVEFEDGFQVVAPRYAVRKTI